MTGTRRIVWWVCSTVALVVLLFSYRTSTPGGEQTVLAGTADPATSTTTTSRGGGSDTTTTATTTTTGPTVQTQWGPVQVEITSAAGRITDVRVVQYPSGNPRDQQINAYAVPRLVDATLTAQSAQIDMVSGATVTSQGYLQSLQAALDEAHL